MPCSRRAKISISAFGAIAHSSDAAVNDADPDHEDATAPEAVAERPAEQDQRRERQQVAVEHPLQVGGRCAEITTDVRQRDVDDRAVEERQPGAQNRDGKHPATGGAVIGDLRASRLRAHAGLLSEGFALTGLLCSKAGNDSNDAGLVT